MAPAEADGFKTTSGCMSSIEKEFQAELLPQERKPSLLKIRDHEIPHFRFPRDAFGKDLNSSFVGKHHAK